MPVTTARFATPESDDGNWNIVGGAASFAAALSDDASGTYARHKSPVSGGLGFVIGGSRRGVTNELVVTVDPTDVDVPVGNRIRAAMIGLELRRLGESGPSTAFHELRVGLTKNSDHTTERAHNVFNTDAYQHNFGWETTLFGEELQTTHLDTMTLFIKARSHPFHNPDAVAIQEAFLYLDHTSPPNVVVQGPSGIIETTSPTAEWAYSQEDSYPQRAYEVKVFSEAQYTSIGFNASSSGSTWESGIVVDSGARSVEIQEPLTNGNYRMYIRLSADWGGPTPDFWSDWQSEDFTVDVVTSPVPSLAVTSDADTGAILIEVSAGIGEPNPDRFTLEKSDAEQGPWEPLMGGDVPAVPLVTLEDHTAPPNRNRFYRARSVRFVDSARIASVPSDPVFTQLTIHEWLLKDTVTGEILTLDIEQDSLDIDSAEDQGVFNTLGKYGDQEKTPPVVVKDSIRADRFSLTIGFLGEEKYEQFKRMRASQHVLFLQAPVTEGPWFMVLGSPVRVKVLNLNDPTYRQVSAPIIEVAPTSDVFGPAQLHRFFSARFGGSPWGTTTIGGALRLLEMPGGIWL